MFIAFAKHRTGLVTFKFTQLLFLADRDIVYCMRLSRTQTVGLLILTLAC